MTNTPATDRFLPSLVIAALFLIVACDPAARDNPPAPTDADLVAGMSRARLSRLDEVIESAIREGAAPGAVVLVGRGGETVFEKAYGNRAVVPDAEPMTLDTIFDMASLTKVMATATAIMTLVDRGQVALTDPVVRYLPEFGAHDKESITLLQLLTHYSGLRPDVDLDQEWSGYGTAIELACAEAPMKGEASGPQFIYSDINYFVLAEIVRRVSGRSIDFFAVEEIFEPLGMPNTRFNPPVEWRPRIAPSEPRDGRMLRGDVHDPTAARMGGVAGHAGLFSTARDTAVFARMILDGGVQGEVRVLSPLAVFQMTRNHAPDGRPDWRGLGFDIRSRFSSNRGDLFPIGSVGHTGFTGTSLWIDPITQTFVILMTSRLHPDGEGNVVALRKRVASVVAGSILDAPYR